MPRRACAGTGAVITKILKSGYIIWTPEGTGEFREDEEWTPQCSMGKYPIGGNA